GLLRLQTLCVPVERDSEPVDAGRGCPQLVGGQGDEVGLQLVAPVELRVCLLERSCPPQRLGRVHARLAEQRLDREAGGGRDGEQDDRAPPTRVRIVGRTEREQR